MAMVNGFRIVLLIAVAGAVVRSAPATLLAADGRLAAAVALDKDFRGPGFYLSWIKILACWLVFLAWVHDHRLGQHRLPGAEAELPALEPDRLRHVHGGVRAGVADSLVLGRFPAAGDRLRRAAGDLHRLCATSTVDNNQRVLTPEHLRYWFATKLSKVGVKIAAEKARSARDAARR